MKIIFYFQVEYVINCFKKKREFVSSLLTVIRGSVIEYDAVEFSQATFLLEKNDFYFLIHFEIPIAFPKEKPEVILQSAYHMDNSGNLLIQKITRYPFNCQMDTLHMIFSILKHIEEKEIDSFQSNCTKKNRT